jgi:peptide deformylase
MSLPIRQVGDPVLRERAHEVSLDELPELQGLIDAMIGTMREAGGAGLAANQVGDLHRILVAEVDHNPRYPYKPVGDETVLINEGCLSVPNLRGDLPRFVTVRARYLDRDGAEQERIVRGLSAGTFQHEVDHLDGVLFLDRSDPRTFTTWDEWERHGKAAFLERIAGLPT